MANKQSVRIQGETESGEIRTARIDADGRFENRDYPEMFLSRDILTKIHTEMRIMNMHLATITNENITEKDLS